MLLHIIEEKNVCHVNMIKEYVDRNSFENDCNENYDVINGRKTLMKKE